jgi:hypothetical protein
MAAMTTFELETGWRHSHPLALCQDIDALLKVQTLTYDLDNLDFVKYFQDRTGQMITLCGCGWRCVVDELANPAKAAPDQSWQITRGKLQDCWELHMAMPGSRAMAEAKRTDPILAQFEAEKRPRLCALGREWATTSSADMDARGSILARLDKLLNEQHPRLLLALE